MTLVYQHLGLGDHILCNGMMRSLASRGKALSILVKAQNIPAVSQMFCDVDVALIGLKNGDLEAADICRQWKDAGQSVLRIGFSNPAWTRRDLRHFDQTFYQMAAVPLEERWSAFRIGKRRPEAEAGVFDRLWPRRPYIFVHDDPSRGFKIPKAMLPAGLAVVRPQPGLTETLFDYRQLIEKAEEIHCISSSFAHWIENERLGQHRYLHRHARMDGSWCTFRNFVVKHTLLSRAQSLL
ncbi:MAG: hypothetical protein WDN45_06425 [Caulobacteraceae bacterium]